MFSLGAQAAPSQVMDRRHMNAHLMMFHWLSFNTACNAHADPHAQIRKVCMTSSMRCPVLCTQSCILPLLIPCALRVSSTPAAFSHRASMLHMAAEEYGCSLKTAPVSTHLTSGKKSNFYMLPAAMGTASPLARFSFTATPSYPRPRCHQGMTFMTGKFVTWPAHCSHVLMFAI